MSTPPYFSTRAIAGIDAALACGAFGQPVSLVLQGWGVEHLRASQSAPRGVRNIYRQLCSLPLYEIDEIFFLADASDEHVFANNAALEDLRVTAIDRQQLSEKIAQATHVLSF